MEQRFQKENRNISALCHIWRNYSELLYFALGDGRCDEAERIYSLTAMYLDFYNDPEFLEREAPVQDPYPTAYPNIYEEAYGKFEHDPLKAKEYYINEVSKRLRKKRKKKIRALLG